MTWTTKASRTVYENPWIRVREDEVVRPDGTDGVYGVVEVRHPAVYVVAVTDTNDVVLVEVDRYTTGQRSLEVPAGGSDGQDPLVAAQRELAEETGLAADRWEHLGDTFALNGVCRAPEHVFLARGLREVEGAAQLEEGITAVHRVAWPLLVARIRSGAITDSETLAALLLAAIHLGWLTG